MQKITPCLWFEYNAEEAVIFYLSVFKNSQILNISYYGEGSFLPVGTVLTIVFQLEGQEFMALNGGPYTHFTPAISFVVDCITQEEVDELWGKLLEGGIAEQCGWLKDKYGVSWQIVPSIVNEMMLDQDKVRLQRVMNALLQMVKIDIKGLKKAYRGE